MREIGGHLKDQLQHKLHAVLIHLKWLSTMIIKVANHFDAVNQFIQK